MVGRYFAYGTLTNPQLHGHRQSRAESQREVNQAQGITAQAAENKTHGHKAQDHAEPLSKAVINDVPGHS